MPSKMNALKTGQYARETLLPWESAEAYETLRREIFADLQPRGALEMEITFNIVENRWLRTRLRRTTAIETHRHAFGQMLEESGPKCWPDALEIVRKHDIDHHKALERIANSMQKIAQHAANWTTSEQLEELAEKLTGQFQTTIDELSRIEAALDHEADFFREYSPKQLEKRVKLENALDAQLDKLMARLINLQEARILRDKSRMSRDAAGDSVAGWHDDADQASKASRQGEHELDLAELDRDDVEEDAEAGKNRSSADQAAPKSTVNRNDDVVDPLVEFLGLSGDGAEGSDQGEPDGDDDDMDEWGEPKAPQG